MQEEQTELTIPEMWRYAKPPVEETEDEKPKPTGPLVGKLVKFLNDIEDPEEFEQKLQEKDPASDQTLLMWATLTGKFVLVEWLIKKAKRAGFAFHNNAKELTIFDKWIEIRKELEEKEREKLLNPPEEEPEEDDEEKAPEPTADQLVYDALAGELEEEGARGPGIVKRIGELGIYQGARNEEGAKNGLGQTLFPNGDVYVGEYVDNKRHGTGTYFFADDGIIYTGRWRDNLRDGVGRCVYPDGGRYYGNWNHDKKHGEGRYTYPDGGAYSGEWSRDTKHGFGTFVFPDGSQHIGTFVQGDFVSGEWRLAGDTRYYGSFAAGSPVGKGVFVLKYGKPGSFRQEGSFNKGVWTPGAILAADATPELEVVMKHKTIKLTFTDESAALPTEALVHAATFGPFLEWQRAMERQSKYYVQNIAISSVRFGKNKAVNEVRAKITVVDAEGKRVRGTDTVVFKQATTRLLTILMGGDKTVAVLERSPNALLMAAEQVVLPQVDIAPNGDYSGRFVDLVAPSLRVELRKQHTYPLDTLQSVNLNSSLSNSTTSVAVYIQHIHADAMAVLQQRLDEACADFGSLYQLRAVRLSDVATMSTDATTIAAANRVNTLLRENKLPTATVDAQRPATPLPPAPEPRPDIEPLLEAERKAREVKEADEAADE